MNYNLGLNITTLGLAIFVMFTLYLMATIMVSVYVNLTPKDFARMSIIVYMLGFLTLAIVVANIVWILFCHHDSIIVSAATSATSSSSIYSGPL